MMRKALPFLFFLALHCCTAIHAQATLTKVRAAHKLRCGVDFEEAEYSTEDAHGNHSLFDLDVCKAIAVAALGPGAKFDAVPFRDESDALKGLKSGEIDVLATASLNYMSTAALAIRFTPPVFYDQQAFLVNRAANIHSAKDLAGKKVCFLGGTELEIQLAGYMARHSIAFLPFSFQEEGEMEAAFITGNCAAVTADQSQLAYERLAFKSVPTTFDLLPDVIAPDPLAIASRSDDAQWSALLSWTVNGLVQAEVSGVTHENAVAMQRSTDPVVQRLLGSQKGYGQYLGLPDDWLVAVLQAVGNYGELYNRDLGDGSVMRIPRGNNELWTRGGLIFPAPIR